ncbi:MAG: hypothetical protein JWO56_1836 [Acidobacteria bacterium]|nr:hypothetical protein [Acidobacteriota bacterium]
MNEPLFFETPAKFRRWLKANHSKATELLVGFRKVGSGKPSMTWKESVDEALCFGWIDGVRKRIDGESYTIRFTPRRKRSIWSDVNIRRANELIELGRMEAAGLAAFRGRDESRSKQYSFENRPRDFPPGYEQTFRSNAKAWTWFESQPPSYRRIGVWYIVSAKQEATQKRRLQWLIEYSGKGERLPQSLPKKKTEE